MANLIFKVKSKSGQSILNSLHNLSTVKMLKDEISKITNIPVDRLIVLVGFPPKPLDLSLEDNPIQATNLRSGETLIIEEIETPCEPFPIENASKESERHTSENHDIPGLLTKMVVPADNSCLFTSFGFTLTGTVDLNSGHYLRLIIATELSSDPVTYNDAFLGRPNEEYCNWIMHPGSWGGAIELAVLSKYYGMEIVVVDCINAIVNRFGEDQAYTHRVFLLFDGIHYDPLYLRPFEDNGINQTIFLTDDEDMLNAAKSFALEARAKKQFTDTAKFSIKCQVCGENLTGEAQALKHAQDTTHTSFGEVSR